MHHLKLFPPYQLFYPLCIVCFYEHILHVRCDSKTRLRNVYTRSLSRPTCIAKKILKLTGLVTFVPIITFY